MKKLRTIGRQDVVNLPEFDLQNVQAKVDTGAYTSSIHCTNVKLQDGILLFTIPIGGKKVYKKEKFITKKIRSSNGKSEHRYVITSNIQLFGKIYKINFSLSDRSKMKNPILIGRRFLKNKFLVDVAEKNLSFEHKSPFS
ncbi:MAG: RimK/LysX family protein [Cyclobacteriaceae bacterium]